MLLASLRDSQFASEILRPVRQRTVVPHAWWSAWAHLLQLVAAPVPRADGGQSPHAGASFFEQVSQSVSAKLEQVLDSILPQIPLPACMDGLTAAQKL